MRTIERSSAFKRDYKRIKATPRHRNVESLLAEIMALLVSDHPLPGKIHDHPLSGDWAGYRECHLKPDLLLIYRKTDDLLRLARIGSHGELF